MTPITAGVPPSAAAPGSTAPWDAEVIGPLLAVTITAGSEVAAARRAANAQRMVRAGTITIPPPTPNRAPRKPAASPIRSRRTRLLYGRGRAGTSRLGARARRPLPRHRRRPRADRRRPRRRAGARRDARRPARAGGALRARRVRHGPPERGRADDRRRLRADDRRRARARAGARCGGVGRADPRVRGARAVAGGGQAAHGSVPLPDGRGPRRGARGARGGRRRSPRRGLPDALGANGARGAAAGRRLEGNCGAATARA